jgi:CMP/dCMP kinase
MAVITISRQYGSGGDEIAVLICKATGYRLFDKILLRKAAAEAGISADEVYDYSEENYKVKNFLSRLFGGNQPVARFNIWREEGDGIRVAEQVQLSEEAALSLEHKAVEFACKQGNMVIVGRGGQVILKDSPGVLHVRLEATLEDRILRVRGDPRAPGQPFEALVDTRRAAKDEIDAHDLASADYLKRFYRVDWSDLALYHLVINTSKLSFDQAAHTIIDTARRMETVREQA